MTHQTSASRKEAKNKAVVGRREGCVGPSQAGTQRKIRDDRQAAVTHASRASGPQISPPVAVAPSCPVRGKTAPYGFNEALFPGKVLPGAQAADTSLGSGVLGSFVLGSGLPRSSQDVHLDVEKYSSPFPRALCIRGSPGRLPGGSGRPAALKSCRGQSTTGQVARMRLGQEARVFGFAGDTSCLHDDRFDMATPPPRVSPLPSSWLWTGSHCARPWGSPALLLRPSCTCPSAHLMCASLCSGFCR